MFDDDGFLEGRFEEQAEEVLMDEPNEDEGRNEPDPGEMDGDAQSALASAGLGVDEDYRGFDIDPYMDQGE